MQQQCSQWLPGIFYLLCKEPHVDQSWQQKQENNTGKHNQTLTEKHLKGCLLIHSTNKKVKSLTSSKKGFKTDRKNVTVTGDNLTTSLAHCVSHCKQNVVRDLTISPLTQLRHNLTSPGRFFFITCKIAWYHHLIHKCQTFVVIYECLTYVSYLAGRE